jgi:hypothetical protein
VLSSFRLHVTYYLLPGLGPGELVVFKRNWWCLKGIGDDDINSIDYSYSTSLQHGLFK